MLSRPAEPPPPLHGASDDEGVHKFREEFVAQDRTGDLRGLDSVRVRMRRLAGRVSGRANRRRIRVLAGATEALVQRCDDLVDRLVAVESLVGEVTDSFGAELANLRAEVAHLRTQAAPLERRKGE
jgi:phage shock protein A